MPPIADIIGRKRDAPEVESTTPQKRVRLEGVSVTAKAAEFLKKSSRLSDE